MQVLGWTLVFTAASLEHLAERDVDADEVADAVFGRHGLARVRRGGRGARTRWFVVAPLDDGEFLTCVLRAAQPRDLDEDGAFVLPDAGEGIPLEFRGLDAVVRERARVGAGRDPELSGLAARQRKTEMTEKKRKLPRFKSDNAERKFWGSHSIEEFGDELADLDVQIRPARTEQIALRLYKDDLETLKKLAKRRGVGHTTLARSVVERWLSTAHPLQGRSARKRLGARRLPLIEG